MNKKPGGQARHGAAGWPGSVNEGRYSLVRHDGSKCDTEDDKGGLPGQPMIKSDRAELYNPVWFWIWSHHTHRCFLCFLHGAPKQQHEGIEGCLCIGRRRTVWRIGTLKCR